MSRGTKAVRFRRDVGVRVTYEDRTEFGSPIGPRVDHSVRALFSYVVDHVREHGFDDLISLSPSLMQRCVDTDAFRSICTSFSDGGWRLREDILHPDVKLAPPRRLTFYREDDEIGVDLTLAADDWPRVHRIVERLSRGADPPVDTDESASRELVEYLMAAGLAEAVTDVPADASKAVARGDLTFVGHNTVLVRSASTAILIDPLFFPGSRTYPEGYQPLSARDTGPVDAILITHSHPDHFDPASLLLFGCDTPVFVPDIGERGESLLTIDMVARLRELGFTGCRALRWNASARIGDIDIWALPFYGEQPTDGDALHPEVRNAGNTYIVRTPRFSAAFVADSGRDGAGDAKQVASRWLRTNGPVDVLFSGYRGWLTYPVQLVFSSVSRYVLFVPPHLWGSRMQLMNDVPDAIDLAERWGARYLVPYGDGGAPWHWRLGLGPCLDGTGVEDPAFDPFAERVLQEAHARTRLPGNVTGCSAVRVLLLRPGESADGFPQSARITRHAGHAWPYSG
jgi:hypothetical protein